MAKKRSKHLQLPEFEIWNDKVPVVETWRGCRQLSDDEWEGIDDGTVVRVRGGKFQRMGYFFGSSTGTPRQSA